MYAPRRAIARPSSATMGRASGVTWTSTSQPGCTSRQPFTSSSAYWRPRGSGTVVPPLPGGQTAHRACDDVHAAGVRGTVAAAGPAVGREQLLELTLQRAQLARRDVDAARGEDRGVAPLDVELLLTLEVLRDDAVVALEHPGRQGMRGGLVLGRLGGCEREADARRRELPARLPAV